MPENTKIIIPLEFLGTNSDEVCGFSLPFKQGVVANSEYIHLLDRTGQPLPLSVKVLTVWPDGSYKNVLFFCFQASASRHNTYSLIVDTDIKKLSADKKFNPVEKIAGIEGIWRLNEISLTTASGDKPVAIFTDKQIETDALSKNFNFQGELKTHLVEPLKISVKGKSFFYNGLTELEVSIVNPNPAEHDNGLWDLGDAGAIELASFDISFQLLQQGNHRLQVNEQANIADGENKNAQFELPEGRLEQYASGGENWQSPVHLNKYRQINYKKNGFAVFAGNNLVKTGKRAGFNVQIGDGFNLTMAQFWQNFPAAVELSEGLIKCQFFKQLASAQYEILQGGEQKTFKFSIYPKHQNASITYFNSKQVLGEHTSEWIDESGILLPTSLPLSPVEQLIQLGINGEQNFFNKREVLDEYGWRNFGELYADHEARGYQGNDIFVSHYNNQYDPIYGFLRQWLRSGEMAWLTLAQDLAQHVKDIDIYHTINDKSEYNQGLFWHTDHYLPAETATHRTYSKYHTQGAYMDHAGGGGPGGQHCYTSGLAEHYLLTGNIESKQTVLALAAWIEAIYDGCGGILEWILALKQSKQAGRKNLFNGHYPLDRGTGNLINAYLDAYLVSSDLQYLQKAAMVIRQTIHPAESVDERQLSDVENHWFYTVLLQAVGRFLYIKTKNCAQDSDFYYARDALLNYAQWMLVHETPYLDKPDILEYPNHTWTGQEMRKVQVFVWAALYADNLDLRSHCWQKALSFSQRIAADLAQTTETQDTRILALLMQNHGFVEYFEQNEFPPISKPRQTYAIKKWSKAVSGRYVVSEFWHRLKKLSIKREVHWLAKRSSKIEKILKKARIV
ncbi:hypothetical protein [Gayadomonas joobiniege]|uniref:RIFT barrel domain-containing protein n=1 Tax=Gayadomonas joobiniege TaxID=1234606 RepID=UPI000368836A|nr:hypothetical protein [Gayadomonas joobiniege]